MIKDAEQTLLSLTLYKLLLKKEKKQTIGTKLSSKVYEIVRECAPLLERIADNMPEYTLHDPNHGAKVAEIMSKIIPVKVLENLNQVELTLLILSGYLHDIGMTCSKEEKEEIIGTSTEFNTLFKSDVISFHSFQSHINNGEYREATFIQDQIFTEYLRQNHVKRSANFIASHLAKGELQLDFDGVCFYEQLISICDGHGEPVKSLKDLNKWPRNTLIGEYLVNIQFLSLVLRLADILDLDPERTPKLIYEHANPKNPDSIIEWKKHRSIIGNLIKQNELLFEAKCSSPEVERALIEFLDCIEVERKETIALLRANKDDVSKRYYLELTEEVTKDRIKNDGSYIYNDLKFSIDYKRVIELLIGERLYKNPVVAIRELIQNSVDALKVREEIYKDRNESFEPFIKLSIKDNAFSIEDNGVGMDYHIFQNFFLQAGKSYYSSKEFYAKFSNLDSVSEFGIGILSVFMITNSLKIESRREPEDPLNPFKPIHFEIPTAYSFTIERKSNRIQIGTKLTLILKDLQNLNQYNLASIVKEIIPISRYNIFLSINDMSETLLNNIEKKIYTAIPHLTTKSMKALPKLPKVMGDKKRNYEWMNIDFSDSKSEILRDIKGTISIINKYENETILGKICQRGFTIGFPSIKDSKFAIKIPESLISLFPSWLFLDVQINLTKSACLNISPDRTEVVIDEKFKKLKKIIEEEIIHRISKQLEKDKEILGIRHFVHLLEYLSSGNFLYFGYQLRKITLSEEAIAFLSNHLVFKCLTPKGQPIFKTINEIRKFENVGVLRNQWKTIHYRECVSFLEQFNIHLVLLTDSMLYSNELENAFYKIFTGKYYEDIDHTIIVHDLLPLFHFHLIQNKIKGLSNIKNQYVSLRELDRYSEIVLKFDNSYLEIEIDKKNKMFDGILFSENESKYNQAFYSLQSEISDVLSDSLQMLAKSNKELANEIVLHLTQPYFSDGYFLFNNIFLRDKKLIEKLESTFLSFFNELEEDGLINSSFKKPRLDYKNFPDYWSLYNQDFFGLGQ